jgi:nucleoporin SEH1
MGRRDARIATACKDQRVRIYKGREEWELVADLREHEAEVWRVGWNVTGTMLTSACDDGKVRVWKRGYVGEEWASVDVINSS